MTSDDVQLFQMDGADWTPLWDLVKQQHAPFYLFHEEKIVKNIQTLRRRLCNVKIAYAMKSNPWLARAASTTADYIEVCSPGELEWCKAYGIPGDQLTVDGLWTVFWKDALDMGCTRFSVDSPEQLKQLLAYARGRPAQVLLRVTSGSRFGMDSDAVKACLDIVSGGDVRICGIQFYPGTQRREPEKVCRELACLNKWIADCEAIPGFCLETVEFGSGLGVPYFEGEEPEVYAKLLNIVGETIQKLQNRYQVVYEAGRVLSASCGIYVAQIFSKKYRQGYDVLFCHGGTNHVCYDGGMLGVRTPVMRGICKHPTGIPGNSMICGPLCSESDILAKTCRTLDSGLSLGDRIVFLGTGAYSATEAANLFLGMEVSKILLYNGQNIFESPWEKRFSAGVV